MKNKLTSRKFLTALTCLITGIILIVMGDTTEGVTAVVSAVVSYCAAEGYVDGKRIISEIQKVENGKEGTE